MVATLIRRPTDGLWQNPDFMRLWGAQTLSAVGTRFTREGLPKCCPVDRGLGHHRVEHLAILQDADRR